MPFVSEMVGDRSMVTTDQEVIDSSLILSSIITNYCNKHIQTYKPIETCFMYFIVVSRYCKAPMSLFQWLLTNSSSSSSSSSE